MLDDPIAAEVRRIREELAKQREFDLDVLFANLRERQKGLRPRLVRRQPAGLAEPGAAPEAQKTARR